MATKNNSKNGKVLKGTAKADTITNTGSKVTISGGTGSDTIVNGDTDNEGGSKVSINAGAGKDFVYNNGDSVTIDTDAGNDFIFNEYGKSVSINGGAGNDSIHNSGYSTNVTITGGTGNDFVSLSSGALYTVIKYKAGDGNDTIVGFGEDDELSISGGSYSTQASGNDVLVKVGKETITLKNAYATADTLTLTARRWPSSARLSSCPTSQIILKF